MILEGILKLGDALVFSVHLFILSPFQHSKSYAAAAACKAQFVPAAHGHPAVGDILSAAMRAVADQLGHHQRQIRQVRDVAQGVGQPAAIVHSAASLEGFKLRQHAVLRHLARTGQSSLTRQRVPDLNVHTTGWRAGISKGCLNMRNILVLSTVGSVLALGLGGFGAAAVESTSGQGLVQKVQAGGDKAPGARGQDGGGKSTTPGSREGGGGPGAGQDRGGEKGVAPQGQREKGAAGEQREKGAARKQRGEKGTEMRSGEKGARGEKQRSTDVEVRGGRDGSRADRRTRIDIDVDRRRRTGGGDVDIRERGYRERGYGYTGSGGLNCQEVLRRYKQCVGR